MQMGIWAAKDLFENNKILPFETWIARGAVIKDYIYWRNIVSCVKSRIKKNTRSTRYMHYPKLGTDKAPQAIQDAREKEMKCIINQINLKSLKIHKIKRKHQEIHGCINDKQWQAIYELPHLILKDNKVKEFQFKILYRYIGTNKLLYKMGKVASNRCTFCELQIESIEHLFFECLPVKDFWSNLMSEWNNRQLTNVNFSVKEIVLGYFSQATTDEYIALNLIIIYAKHFIYKCKLQLIVPALNKFKLDKMVLEMFKQNNGVIRMLDWLV